MISLSYKKSLYIQTVFTLLLTSVCSILFYLHGINQMKNMIYENIKSHISDVVYMSHKSLSTGDSADIDPYIKYKMLQLKGVKSISIFQDRNVIASTSDGIIYENLPLSMEKQDALTMFRHSLYTVNFITGGIKYTVAVQITPEITEHARYTFKRDISILTLSILLIVSSVQFVIYYLLYYLSFSRFYDDVKNRRFDIIYPITELTGLSRLVRGLVATLNRTTQETESQKELFRTLFYNLPIASFYKDKDGKYLGGNEEFCHLIGMEEAEILGKTAYDVLDETTAEELEARDKSLYENPDTMQIYEEDIHIKWLKKTRSVVYYKCALRGRDKTPLGVVAVMMDISHKKRQERLNRLQISIAEAFLLENEYDIFRRLSSAVISEFGCRGAYVTYIDAAGAEVNPLFSMPTLK